jgi:hypothetical protein
MGRPPRKSGSGATFTKAAAKRIQRAVLTVERGGGDMSRPSLRTAGSDVEIIRGTFTAPWSKDATKTVTDAIQSSVTYEANNYFAEVSGTGEKKCAIGLFSGEWILLTVDTGSGTEIVRGTFAAPWSKGSTKSVTSAASSGQTYTAKNYFAEVAGTGSKACAIAYVNSEWILIAAEC